MTMSEWDFSELITETVETAHQKALDNRQFALVTACRQSQVIHTTYHDGLDAIHLTVSHITIHSPGISTYVLGADISNVVKV